MVGIGHIAQGINSILTAKSTVNGLGFVPMKSNFGNAFDLAYIPVNQIKTDEKNFQNRTDKYSEKSVNAIIKAVKNNSFNWFAFDPVLLWQNPDGDLFVLSGHSRTEAFRRLSQENPDLEIDGLNFSKIPAKIFKGDFVNAKNLALNSNALSTPETLLERADFYRKQRQQLSKRQDIAKLREKALRENQGAVIWDLSFLPSDGLTVDSLKRFKMQEDSEAAFENYIRAVNIAQWIGKAFQIYPRLSKLHDNELFKFLVNNYGTKSGQYNSFSKLNDRLSVLYPRNVANVEKVDFDGNFSTPFGLVIYEKNEDEISELQELESEAKRAKRELDKKIKDLRSRTSDKAQIFEIVTPYFNDYVNSLFQWWNSLDREKVRKTDKNQGALFGMLSQMIDDNTVNNSDILCAGLGKPTVKFEFEDNDSLFNFFTKSKKDGFKEAKNVVFEDVEERSKKQSKRSNVRQSAITTPETLYLPYSEGSMALPGSANPKSLPPASQYIPPLSSILQPDGVYINHRKIGDYGYINDKLKYINFYIDKEYMVNDNIFKWSERIFPHAVIIICFQDNGIWKFYFQRPKYKDFIYKKFPNSFIQNSGIKYFIFDLQHIEKVIQAFEREGFPVVLIYRNIVEDINDLSTQTSPKALPPATSPQEPTTQNLTAKDWENAAILKSLLEQTQTTPETVIKAPSVQSPNFYDYERRFANASGWASFDPEQSAKYNVGAYKELYNYYVQQVDPSKVDAFNNFFDTYVNNLISARSRTANVAVTGGGGISASKARKLNAASDRYMEMSANFKESLEDFVKKLNRSARRAEFVQMTNEERSDERFNELKKVVDSIATSQENYKKYKKEPSLMPQEDYEFYLKHYNIKNKKEAVAWALNSLQYNVGLDKAGLYDKILREYRNGNNLTVNRILEYLKGKNVFTDKHKIWKLYKAVADKPDFETSLFDSPKNYEGAEIVENRELDRVQIKFAGIPSEDCRTELKGNGFRWSPFYKVWQRKLTPQAVRVANEIVSKYYSSTGLGKPSIKLEFEDNAEIFKMFGGEGLSGEPSWIFNCPDRYLNFQGFKPTYKFLASYDSLIDKAEGGKTLKGYGFEPTTLNELNNACKYYRQVERLAKHLKADDYLQSAFNLWHWLHKNIRYNYDTPGAEEIRTPARTWADRESGVDCDCLSVFTACVLYCMGYEPRFEIVGFDDSGTYSHIFVNLYGSAIDRVLPVFLKRPPLITITKIMDIPVFQLNGGADIAAAAELSGIYESTLRKINAHKGSAEDSVNEKKMRVLIQLQGSDDNVYKFVSLIMPFVAVIDDDGAFYFNNEYAANLIEKADRQIYNLRQSGADESEYAEVLSDLAKELKTLSVEVAKTGEKTSVTVTFNNSANEAVKVSGELTKKELLTVNPAYIEMREALQKIIAVNLFGIATKFAIGLMTESQAASLGVDSEKWQEAVTAVSKLKTFWKMISGSETALIESIINGAEKVPLTDNINLDSQIVETAHNDAVLSGCRRRGLRGVDDSLTVEEALNRLGVTLDKILAWCESVDLPSALPESATPNTEPTETVIENTDIDLLQEAAKMPVTYVNASPAEDDSKMLLYSVVGSLLAVSAISAFSGKKKKSKRR